MKNPKKLITIVGAVVLLIAIIVFVVLPQFLSEKGHELLPYNLSFGMSHKEAKSTCKGFPAISQSYDGYFSDSFEPKPKDYYKRFGIDPDILAQKTYVPSNVNTKYYFSFNEHKKLSAFSVITQAANEESAAQYLYDRYADYLTAYFGQYTNRLVSGISFQDDTLRANLEIKTERTAVPVYIVHLTVFSLEYTD